MKARRARVPAILLSALAFLPENPLVVSAAAQMVRRPAPGAIVSAPLSLSAPALTAPAPLFSPIPAAAVSAAPAAPAAPAALATALTAVPRALAAAASPAEPGKAPESGASLFDGASRRGTGPAVSIDWSLIRRAPQVLRSAWTKPNRQDYAYLVTKTFGLNLAVRAGFAALAVSKGELPATRALMSTSWYQLQDAAFTLFGQTYMKFLDKMTGAVKIGRAAVGDLAFVYLQLCGFEFLNRLVLGAVGDNPLVYTPKGLALIFVNVLQGMVSGGPLAPAINKLRRADLISESTMMHLYQLASLTMLFGLFASFGYQRVYTMLTAGTLILSWGTYGALTWLRPEAKP